MIGWRARVGYISPGVHINSQEWDRPLPEGVVWAVVTLGVDRLVPEEFEQALQKCLWAGKVLASREADYIIVGGAPAQLSVGYERSLEMAKEIEKATGIPTKLQLTTAAEAFEKLSAKKIIIASPYEQENNEKHKKFIEKQGFEVINVKGLGAKRNLEITKQPGYASYRLAKEAFRETPRADAIWIPCTVWPVLSNVALLEKDLGIPVVPDIIHCLYAALTALNIKGPIKGFGKLLEML